VVRKRQRVYIPKHMTKLRAALGKSRSEIPAPTAEIVPLQAKLKPILQRAWPKGSDKDISWLTVDLAALWEVSRVHIILIKKLLRMKGKPNKKLLAQIAIELEINWYSNASGHLETLEQELNKLQRGL
jgi:hypothetical protein